MKLLIDIPDKDYEFIKNAHVLINRGNGKRIEYNMINAIKNGTPVEDQPTESLISRYCHDTMSDVFKAGNSKE